ncbi:MAG: sulfatase-like hydrolase/transferase [Gammaproteobacteria bacterium]
MINRLILVGAIAVAGFTGVANSAPNILLIIGDDMGVETLSSYGLGENTATTATLDEMAREGVRFTNFWSQPICSPTRATMLTGRYGFRTGVGGPVAPGEPTGPLPEPPAKPGYAPAEWMVEARDPGPLITWGLSADEYTLPMAFYDNSDLGYSTAAIGKWHLADTRNGWLDHPNRVGFDHYSGLITGEPHSYFAWNQTVNGEISGATGYTPTDKVNDALEWIDEQEDTPWFLWFAFNLPHIPLHLPPQESLQGDYSSIDPSSVPEDTSVVHFRAMLEAMDAEINRLLASLDPDVRENTYVIFLGDNGTANRFLSAPFPVGRGKNSIYEGGINVPLIITGPGVQRNAVSDALVNSTDLFNTILEMAGINPEETVPDDVATDSVSFLPALLNPDAPSLREWIFADRFVGSQGRNERASYAMRDEQYKLLRHAGAEEFYDLHADPYESDNLLRGELSAEQGNAYEALKKEVARLRDSE